MAFKKTEADTFKSNSFAKTFYVEKDLICRILPAMENADSPYKKWLLVWIPGDGKTKARCFATTSNQNGGKCPVASLQDKLSTLIKNPQLLVKYPNYEEILKKLKDIAFKLNLQAFYAYNVVVYDPKTKRQGQGVAHIKTTAHKALVGIVNEYLDQGFDPLDIQNGVWFRLQRVEENGRTTYTASKHMMMYKEANGRTNEKLWDEPIDVSEDILEEKASDLSSLYNISDDNTVREAMMGFIERIVDRATFVELMKLADKV